jgi:acyl-CoA dehydrogenase
LREKEEVAVERILLLRQATSEKRVAAIREIEDFLIKHPKCYARADLDEIKTELTVGRAFIDQCIAKHCAGELSIEEAAMSKWWTTELLGRVTDSCLQLHGGYGYTHEYSISAAWVDARITRIYGGTTEIMKELIGRGMGL